MKIFLTKVILLIASVVIEQTALAVEPTSLIYVDPGFARATIGHSDMSAGYLSVTNSTGRAIVLKGITSDSVGKIEVHETINENGLMKMRELGSVVIQPGTTFKMAPKGNHMMLLDLKHPLTSGELLDMELIFDVGTVHAKLPVAN